MTRHAALAVAVAAGFGLPVLAQSGAPGTDTRSPLLVEVRALRVAMERAATTTPQIQPRAGRSTPDSRRR